MNTTTPQGATIVPERDFARLARQLDRVREVVLNRVGPDDGWLTLAAIGSYAHAPEASVSARLRELRRAGYTVERRYVRNGVHQYRVSEPKP